ncbi:MAG TPA: glycosyltransferase family 4 protein [Ignavibacteriaceae bacterium]|nr:glycosyltransferase family 4 protein [Ignavibacteriaceae bacterium]
MNALVISPQPFFSPRGTPFSIYYRTLVMSELGVKIDFLTYGEGQDVNIPGVNIIRIPRFKSFGNVKIGPSPLKLFLDFFIFLKMFGLLIRNKYDFVHAHEESVFFAYLLKPFFKFKLIYDMHSSLPQQLANFNFSESKLLFRIFKGLEDGCLKKAAAVITICPDLYNYVNNIIIDKSKHFLIENSIFDPVNLKSGQNKGKETEHFNPQIPSGAKLIVYAGTLEKYQGIDILVASFKEVAAKKNNVMLIIVGGTKDQIEYYSKLAAEKGISEKVIFTGRLPQQIAKKYISSAAVLVSPRSDGTNTPLKIYEQIASGIPLVATNIYSHTQVLNDEVAFLVDPEPSKMADGLLASLNSEEMSMQKVRNALKLYEEKYSRNIYKEKVKHLLELLN